MKVRTLAISMLALTLAGCGGEDRITGPTGSARATLLNAIGTDPVTGATIETNKDDYVPGEVVHLQARGWAPNETVRLFMTEDPDTHGDVTMDVQADATGAFSLHFYDVQDHDLGVTFYLTATGLASGSSATAVFTDARSINSVTVNGTTPPPGVSVAAEASVAAVVNGSTTCTGPSAGCVPSAGSTSSTTDDWKSTKVILTGPKIGVGPFVVTTQCVPGINVTGPTPAGGTNHTFNFEAPEDAGTYDVQFRMYSDIGCTAGESGASNGNFANGLIVTAPLNVAPTANAGGPNYSGSEGSAIELDGSGSSDTDGNVVGYAWDYALVSADAGTTCLFDDATSEKPKISCTDDGIFTVKLVVTDDDGATSAEATAALTVTNVAPTVTVLPASQTINEGSSASFTATITDPGSNDLTDVLNSAVWSTTVASCSLDAGATATAASFTCLDNGTGKVKLAANDGDANGSSFDEVDLTVDNVPPSITGVTLTPLAAGNIYPITQPVTVTATFTDPGTLDTHTCTTQAIALNVAAVNAGPANAASGGCANTLSFLEAGVYAVTITVMDKDGGSDSETSQVIVYDPSAGFVTGGGWITSPAGAYYADPSLTGKATFGFVARYKKGATVPEGNTQFVFHAGGFSFHSADYDFLIVNQNGTNAQYKGRGTVNGTAGYTFMLWAKDDAPDQLRIKIWVTATNAVVYDNLLGGADGEMQAIANGSIVIHTPKK